MANPPEDFLIGRSLMRSISENASVLIIIQKIKQIKELEQNKKIQILTQKNYEGNTVLTLAIKSISPQILPALLELINDLPQRNQEKIFRKTLDDNIVLVYRNWHFLYLPNLLKYVEALPDTLQATFFKRSGLLTKLPSEFIPIALKIIKKFDVLTKDDLFKQTDEEGKNGLCFIAKNAPEEVPNALELIEPCAATIFEQRTLWGVNAAMFIAKYAPKSFPRAWELIKQLPKKVRDKIIKQQDNRGEGLEFYIVSGADIELLKTVVAMGFPFNKGAQSRHRFGPYGLLGSGLKNEMLSALISDCGLNPEHEPSSTFGYVWSADGTKPLNINLSQNTAELNKLYRHYLNSLNLFVIAEVASVVPIIPTVLISIIADYLPLNQSQERSDALEEIDLALRLRTQWLKPLADYCLDFPLDTESKTLLDDLLHSKKLLAWEEEWDLLLKKEGFSKRPYAFSFIQCRLNGAKASQKAVNLPENCKKILRDKALELESAAFQFKVLRACAAICPLTLILGIIAICILHPIAVGIILVTASTVVLGKSAYGLYAHERDTIAQDDEKIVPITLIRASS